MGVNMANGKLVYTIRITGERPIAQLMALEETIKRRILELNVPMTNVTYSPEVRAIFQRETTDLSNALVAILAVYDNPTLE